MHVGQDFGGELGETGCVCIRRATQLREGPVPCDKQLPGSRASVLAREEQFCAAVMLLVSAREERVCAAHRGPVSLLCV